MEDLCLHVSIAGLPSHVSHHRPDQCCHTKINITVAKETESPWRWLTPLGLTVKVAINHDQTKSSKHFSKA